MHRDFDYDLACARASAMSIATWYPAIKHVHMTCAAITPATRAIARSESTCTSQLTPNSAPRPARWAISAALTRAFVGMHPALIQVPPSAASSISITVAPSRRASSPPYVSDENTRCGPSGCGQCDRNSAIHLAHRSSSAQSLSRS